MANIEDREQWGSKYEYYLSLIGYSVGVGNIWRFPYLVMRTGGGAFLIPYFLFLFLCGIPIYYAECILGQYSGLSGVKAFDFAPFFNGIGWAMVFLSLLMSCYYNVLMAYIIFYLFNTFKTVLPWTTCNNPWNTDKCFEYRMIDANTSLIRGIVAATGEKANSSIHASSASEFWYNYALNVTDVPMEMGSINWKIFGSFLFIWIVTFLCMAKGIKSSGKVVYVTALAPFLFLTILVIRGVTLPGSMIGIKYYLYPNWEKLKNPQIWSTAGRQIFYSLGPSWGGIICMSSFNKRTTNIRLTSLILPLICCCTSVYAGIAIYSVIGHLAKSMGTEDITALNMHTFGLAFIVYPEGLNHLPVPQFWTFCFFFMLFTLGLDSQFGTLDTFISGICDEYPNFFRGKRRFYFTFIICLSSFLIGTPFCFQGGSYYFEIFDSYSSSIAVVVIGIFEVISFGYFYDSRKFIENVDEMLGKTSSVMKYFWYACWYFITPALLLPVIGTAFINMFDGLKNHKGVPYPKWSIGIGLSFGIAISLIIPVKMIYELILHRKNPSNVFKPSKSWQQIRQKKKDQPQIYIK